MEHSQPPKPPSSWVGVSPRNQASQITLDRVFFFFMDPAYTTKQLSPGPHLPPGSASSPLNVLRWTPRRSRPQKQHCVAGALEGEGS